MAGSGLTFNFIQRCDQVDWDSRVRRRPWRCKYFAGKNTFNMASLLILVGIMAWLLVKPDQVLRTEWPVVGAMQREKGV